MPRKVDESKLTPASRDYTINLHRLCHKLPFKKRAPRMIREIKKFAQKNMLTQRVKVSTEVNKYIWKRGIRNVPRKIRVRLMRVKNEEDINDGGLITEVKLLKVSSFKGLVTEVPKAF